MTADRPKADAAAKLALARSVEERLRSQLATAIARADTAERQLAEARAEIERLLNDSMGLMTQLTENKRATRAIQFAVKIDDHYDRLEFLNGWLEGDTSEWPEFAAAIRSPQEQGEG